MDKISLLPVPTPLSNSPWFFLSLLGFLYLNEVHRLRFKRVDALKTKYGFTEDPKSYGNMTIEQAQEIERSLAEWDMPFVYEFGWLFDFFRPSTSPPLSVVTGKSGHFTSPDSLVAHQRQQDTICLMTAFLAQPLKSEYSSLALARINVHHLLYPKINSDSVLYLIWHFWWAPIRMMNQFGWRRVQDFEVHATWIVWRELALRMGCKYVPETIAEMEEWKDAYRSEHVYPHRWNKALNDGVLGMVLYKVPDPLKWLARDCILAMLDDEIIWASGWQSYAYTSGAVLRPLITGAGLAFAFYQRWLCLPRLTRYVRSPEGPNPKTGRFNFPDYAFGATPFYVMPTIWNQWGPWALLKRLRGMPVPGLQYSSEGIAWEAMGAKRPTKAKQTEVESRVRQHAEILMAAPWGYRAPVGFQARPLVRPLGLGYGSRAYAYEEGVEPFALRAEQNPDLLVDPEIPA
ncbi:MAG: hypothetical protein M1832_003645 [Thelocarpon impressellum]|nr:MAG: hypothetical protein M1832_003645 [Thelocarpon impressellum]